MIGTPDQIDMIKRNEFGFFDSISNFFSKSLELFTGNKKENQNEQKDKEDSDKKKK